MTHISEPLGEWKAKKDAIKQRAYFKAAWGLVVLGVLLFAIFGNSYSFECFCFAVVGGAALKFM